MVNFTVCKLYLNFLKQDTKMGEAAAQGKKNTVQSEKKPRIKF